MRLTFKKLMMALTPMVLALPLAMDIYVPAIPHLTLEFGATDAQMLLTLNWFMLISGIMQLIIGPMSDHFGRQKTALIMISFFTLGSILCANAHNAQQLLQFRIIQAMGACGMLVLAFAIVRDYYQEEKSAKAYSFLNAIISFSPIFATFIGSYLDFYFGWQSTFWFLLLVSLPAYWIMAFILNESLPKSKRTLLSFNIWRQYWVIICNPKFEVYNFASAFGHCYLYLFCALSPYLIIRTLELPQTQYGFYFCFMGISLLIGSFFGGVVVEKIGIWRTCMLGYLLTFLGGCWMFFWYKIQGLSIHNFIYPMLFIGTGGTLCMGAGTGGFMAPFDSSKGAAAAAGGAFRFFFAGVVGYISIRNSVQSTLPLSIPAMVFSIIGAMLLLVHKFNIKEAIWPAN